MMHDVSGVVGLSGDVVGSIALAFPSATAKQDVTILGGVAKRVGDREFADAMSELLALIVGDAKQRIEGKGVSIGIPSVVVGAVHEAIHQIGTPVITIPCACDLGEFSVLVVMEQ
jgi:chemotaxis protein CheX